MFSFNEVVALVEWVKESTSLANSLQEVEIDHILRFLVVLAKFKFHYLYYMITSWQLKTIRLKQRIIPDTF